MTRNLHELDKVYSRLNKKVDIDERIKYCMSLIQKTKDVVTNRKQHLTDSLINKSSELINAAEMEIMKLYQNKNKTRFK
jgi:hypothetical protein